MEEASPEVKPDGYFKKGDEGRHFLRYKGRVIYFD
jgi:hypothetical protein